MRVSCTGIPSSRASCKIVSRVIPSRIELARSGVWSTPRFTMKMFSPEPSETYPFASRRIASSYPPNFASRLARTLFVYWPVIFAFARLMLMWWRANEEILQRIPFLSASSPRYAPHFQR